MSLGFKLKRFLFNAVSSTRQEFYQDFASALKAGDATNDRLRKLALRARRRKGGGWAPLYEHWLRKMRRMPFSRALQHTVPAYEVMVLTAAEEDARLDEAMVYLADSIDLLGKMRSTYFMSLISPLLGFVCILGFFLAYAFLIAPQNLESMPLAKWPPVSLMLYSISMALTQHGIAILVGSAATVSLVLWSRENWRGRIRSKVERVPMLPWKGYRERQSNNFLVALAILLQSNNHGLKEALTRMRMFASPWLAWHITVMLKRVALTPDTPARALDTGLFSQRLMDRIEDYAERSDFHEALRILAFDDGKKTLQAAQVKAVMTGFLAMVIVGMVLGVVVLGGFEFNQAFEQYMRTMR